jgi:DNA processing protein
MEAREILEYLSLKFNGDWGEIAKIIREKKEINFDDIEEVRQELDTGTLSLIDSTYPQKFKNIPMPPWVIYYKGDISLLNKNIISFVGSRETSQYYLDAVDKIIEEISCLNKDIVICSGLAKGIDSCAHLAALKYGLKTIAVLPVGIDECYPKENFKLYEEISQNGLLISEYPKQANVKKEAFTFRNRIITALSDNLVVAEVKNCSGTLASINWALTQGKDIFCIPSPYGEETLNNIIIKEGAYILTSGEDLVKKF